MSNANGASMASTWSNRWGATLTPIATGLWAAERPFTWNGIDVGGRSVIARLPPAAGQSQGPLLVHSPVAWDAALGACLQGLGGTPTLVAPNFEHLKHIRDWSVRYPTAPCYACPGLPARLPDVAWTAELGVPGAPPIPGLESLFFDCEHNPFKSLVGLFKGGGSSDSSSDGFFNEVVFYHPRSRALILTDLFWNYPSGERPNYDLVSGTGLAHQCPKVPLGDRAVGPFAPSVPVPLGTRLWKFGMDRVYLPFYKRVMVGGGERRERYLQCVAALLAWDVELIVPCHGDVVRGRELCRAVLRRHFLDD